VATALTAYLEEEAVLVAPVVLEVAVGAQALVKVAHAQREVVHQLARPHAVEMRPWCGA